MSIKRIEIQIPKYLEGIIIKDLQENEVICEDCGGVGLRIVDYRYGIQGEDTSKGHFPYNKQTIGMCQSCYNGVREKCRFCGKLLPRGYMKCDCKDYEQYDEDKYKRAEQERFDKAKKISYEEYAKQFPDYMIYCEDNEKYYSELEDLEYDCEDDELAMPKYVYGTYRISIGLDIDNILESACDELFEDAVDSLDGIDELNSAIDKFTKLNANNTATYYPDYKLVILL